jgi:hypothetical protein
VLAALFGLGLAALILVNFAGRRKWGLVGELAYAVVVMSVAVWAVGQIRVVRATLRHFRVPPFSLKRAFLWSAFVLVAIPVAIVQWPYGPVVLALGPLIALLLYLRRDSDDPPWWRSPWIGAAGGIVLVLATATISPQLGDARPPNLAPAAAEERPENRALAASIRPILLFDEVEQRYPVDIEAMMGAEQVRACREAVLGDPCPLIKRASEIDLGADYLAFDDVAVPRGGGAASAYYYRVVDERPRRIYVDFWWFFTRNPSPVAGGVFCAPGFRLPGKTCHEHASDWEGVTVVLAPCRSAGRACIERGDGPGWAPIAVRYAQHEFLVSYPWPTLRRLWQDVRRDPLRPLVFVARDSHASYAGRCRRNCKQFRLGFVRREGSHDGRTPWRWNGENCGDCLQPLPITSDEEPAEWSAFEGRWGDQNCLLGGAYCDATGAPRAPPQQDRYSEPWHPGPWLCLAEPSNPDSKALRRCARAVSPDGPLPT